MDAAQVARNLAEGHGFTTEFIRPFSIYLLQKHNRAAHPEAMLSTNTVDLAQMNGWHPDLANAPVYPVVLAGLMKLRPPGLESGNCASRSGRKAAGSCAISRNFSSPSSTRFCCWWSCC